MPEAYRTSLEGGARACFRDYEMRPEEEPPSGLRVDSRHKDLLEQLSSNVGLEDRG